MKQGNGKKLIAPIVVTILMILYLIGYAAIWIFIPEIPLAIKIGAGVIALAFAGVCVYVLVERIEEIRSGEEDDLSQY